MNGHDIIVIGGSAGALDSLIDLVAGLPQDLEAAVFVVIHIAATAPSVLPRILGRAGKLPVQHARNGDAIGKGRIYVAPPDHHLILDRTEMRLGRGPKENSARPAIDPLFRTAARAFGPRVIGVVLSGMLDDGSAGLLAIKQRGGTAIAQDPQTAQFPSMPRAAIEAVPVDHVLAPEQIAAELVRLSSVQLAAEGETPVSKDMNIESDFAELEESTIQEHHRPGNPSGYSCPECHGTLFELSEGELMRFRCRVGHAYSSQSLLAEQAVELEAALWAALATLKERSALSDRMSSQAAQRGHTISATHFEQQARHADARAELIRQALLLLSQAPAEPDAPLRDAPSRAETGSS